MQSRAVADAWHAGSVQMNIWMDSWQMNCCGERFETESKVSWTLRSATGLEWLDVVVGHGTAATIDAVEDHHGGTASGNLFGNRLTGSHYKPTDVHGSVAGNRSQRVRGSRLSGVSRKTLICRSSARLAYAA